MGRARKHWVHHSGDQLPGSHLSPVFSSRFDAGRSQLHGSLALQVYAYTSSPLELSILNLFVRAHPQRSGQDLTLDLKPDRTPGQVRPEYRLPNLFVGSLTRDSVLEALSSGARAAPHPALAHGRKPLRHARPCAARLRPEAVRLRGLPRGEGQVDADQIVTYLQQHPHPAIARRTPILPETVGDQIHLWGRAATRLRATGATLYSGFGSVEAFRSAKARAEGMGALLWDSEAALSFAARPGLTSLVFTNERGLPCRLVMKLLSRFRR